MHKYDLSSLSSVKKILREHGIYLQKKLGQNFLVDRNVLTDIVTAAHLKGTDVVLEVGAGIGTLAQVLAEYVKRVITVEIDHALLPVLENVLKPCNNVTIVPGNFLKMDMNELLGAKSETPTARVIANVPYYITSSIIIKLLEDRERFESIILMVQKEVADRLTARQGSKDYGSISVFVQYYSKVRELLKVPKESFFPAPEVDSVVVELVPYKEPVVKVFDEILYFKVVHSAFGQRRKTLLNALTGGTLGIERIRIQSILEKAGIDPMRRGETLSLEEFAKISNIISKPKNGKQND